MPIIATRGVLDVSLLVRQLKHKSFICNALKCLNEENKNFSNSLFLPLYLIFFSLFGMHLIDILTKKTKSSLYLIFFLSSLTLCLYLNVRQLNHMCFICNIFNYLNEKNKKFTKSLSLYFLFIFSCFLFISQCETIKTYEFYLECI
jgi:hypothetical protein